ncbi:MAG: DUF2203 domain-containing protein [Thermoplasmatota archaeon]
MTRVDPGRLWKIEEANAALERVRAALAHSRRAAAALHEAEEQMQDLRIVWGDQVLAVACPDHAEWVRWRDLCAERMNEVEVAGLRFQEIGCELKDVEAGLVDFRGQLGSEVVYLCWRDGEEAIRYYHPLHTGFSGRRPIPAVSAPSP